MSQCDYQLYYDEDAHEVAWCRNTAIYRVFCGTDGVPEMDLCEEHKPRILALIEERGKGEK